MNVEEFKTELEVSFNKIIEELTVFKNSLSLVKKEKNKNIHRKALVLMLYSYFEGFVKESFLLYIDFINDLNLRVSSLKNNNLLALSMSNIFKNYDDSNRKHPDFKKKEDKKLHLLFRRVDFLEKFKNSNNFVKIKKNVVDTESNLTRVVMRKLLYQFGISYNKLDFFSPKIIQELLNKRNNIAHAYTNQTISEKEYKKLDEEVIKIMKGLINTLSNEAEMLEKLKK